MFSEYCANPFEVEAAEVVNPDGSVDVYPTLNYRTEKVSKGKVNKLVGESYRIYLSPMGSMSYISYTHTSVHKYRLETKTKWDHCQIG